MSQLTSVCFAEDVQAQVIYEPVLRHKEERLEIEKPGGCFLSYSILWVNHNFLVFLTPSNV
jgi:hypothetical protein